MAIFRPKPWVNPFGKMPIFRFFGLFLFIAQSGVFSIQNIVKEIFLVLIAFIKKLGKMAIFGPKPWVNPLGKMLIFRVFELLLFIAQKGVFSFVLEYRKTYFPGLNCLKKKVGKMAIFGPKPWVNSLGKMSIIRVFELLVFIAQKGVFSFQNIVKDIFLA